MNSATELRLSPFSLAHGSTRVRQASLVLVGSLVVAGAAHIAVPLPWTPVPVTLSNLAVLLVGFALGPTLGATALLLYLLEGALGLPVFNAGGPGGLAQLLHFTSSGYLLAYPAAACLAGLLSGSGARNVFAGRMAGLLRLGFAAAVSTTLVMLCGFCWLAFALHLGAASAFRAGVLPFLPGELIKIVAAAGLGQPLLRLRAAGR